MRGGLVSHKYAVLIIALLCGMPAAAGAQCATQFIPPQESKHWCSGFTQQELDACQQQAHQRYLQQVEQAHQNWQIQVAQCQSQQAQEAQQKKEAADRAAVEAEGQRAAADNQRYIAEQKAKQAAAERDQQQAEAEKARLAQEAANAQAATQAEKARLTAELANAQAAAAEAERRQKLTEIFSIRPNSYPVVAAAFALVSFLTWASKFLYRRIDDSHRSLARDIAVETAATILSTSCLYFLGILTDVTWLSFTLFGGAITIGVSTQFKPA